MDQTVLWEKPAVGHYKYLYFKGPNHTDLTMMDEDKKPARTRKPKEHRIEDILFAAEEVFNENGIEKATVAEIARRAGVVEGTVFRYFNSKHELVFQIISRWYEAHFDALIKGLKGITGTRNRLRYIIWSQLQSMNERAELTGAIILAARGFDEAFTKQVNAHYARTTQPLFETLEHGMDSGELRPDISPQLVSHMLYGGIEQSLWKMLQEGIRLDVEKVADDMVDLIYAGIARVADPSPDARELRLVKKLEELLDKHEPV